jgi:polyisoprenoid-binding protein YceI
MKSLYLFLFLLLSVTIGSYAQFSFTLESSSIRYNGYHVAHDWSGVSTTAKGILIREEGVPHRIAISVPLNSFDSNSSNRDSNALRVLNALKFPEVRFYSENIREIDAETVELSGFFELNGLRKEYRVILNAEEYGDLYEISGEFKVNLLEFDLKLPRFLLKPIDENIDLTVNLKFKQNS